MKLSDFDFDLPDDLIATRPARPRSSARLLVAEGDAVRDLRVADLPAVLRPGDLLVLNDTRVLAARLSGLRRRGGASAAVEVTLLEPQADGSWTALARPLRKLRPGDTIEFGGDLSGRVAAVAGGQARLRFDLAGAPFEEALERAGAMPLPPYIERLRPADEADRTDYQTVWARRPGAVAAPTASLHFDEALLAALAAGGVTTAFVTLHVGAGTFLPVKVEDVTTHRMHAERGEVPAGTAEAVNDTRAAGGRVIAVGTTALRVLESAAAGDGRVHAWQGSTEIFIYPGYRFCAIDGLMTNFHLPRSTLLMLVSALMGRERILALYAHAIRERYRFFSYGDASLLLP